MAKVDNVLIIGTNRGIGLALVKETLIKLKPTKLFATYRTEAKSQELFQLAKENSALRLIQMEATNESKFPAIVKQIDEETNGRGLNLLVCNAGISEDEPQTMDLINKNVLLKHFEINSVAPMLLAKAFLPLLEKASEAASAGVGLGLGRAAIVNISSQMGSFGNFDMTYERAGHLAFYAYRTSKAALNIFTLALSKDVQDKKILAVAIHPGSVQTDLGFPEAPLTAKQSAEGIMQIVGNLGESHNGKFFNYDGNPLPW